MPHKKLGFTRAICSTLLSMFQVYYDILNFPMGKWGFVFLWGFSTMGIFHIGYVYVKIKGKKYLNFFAEFFLFI